MEPRSRHCVTLNFVWTEPGPCLFRTIRETCYHCWGLPVSECFSYVLERFLVVFHVDVGESHTFLIEHAHCHVTLAAHCFSVNGYGWFTPTHHLIPFEYPPVVEWFKNTNKVGMIAVLAELSIALFFERHVAARLLNQLNFHLIAAPIARFVQNPVLFPIPAISGPRASEKLPRSVVVTRQKLTGWHPVVVATNRRRHGDRTHRTTFRSFFLFSRTARSVRPVRLATCSLVSSESRARSRSPFVHHLWLTPTCPTDNACRLFSTATVLRPSFSARLESETLRSFSISSSHSRQGDPCLDGAPGSVLENTSRHFWSSAIQSSAVASSLRTSASNSCSSPFSNVFRNPALRMSLYRPCLIAAYVR